MSEQEEVRLDIFGSAIANGSPLQGVFAEKP
jgi:hypothetical protein